MNNIPEYDPMGFGKQAPARYRKKVQCFHDLVELARHICSRTPPHAFLSKDELHLCLFERNFPARVSSTQSIERLTDLVWPMLHARDGRPKLRLVMWQDCHRDCPKCCNKRINWHKVPTFAPNMEQHKGQFTELLVSGGEPLLYSETLAYALMRLRACLGDSTPCYVYTAAPHLIGAVLKTLRHVDGMTFTLHDKKATWDFERLASLLPQDKSYKLITFEGAPLPKLPVYLQDMPHKVIRWLDECPLPQGEILRKYW